MNTEYKKFIGAAIPIDIIHHVYGGDKSKIFGRSTSSPYRFERHERMIVNDS